MRTEACGVIGRGLLWLMGVLGLLLAFTPEMTAAQGLSVQSCLFLLLLHILLICNHAFYLGIATVRCFVHSAVYDL